jgi:serine O-acetyltransferase
VARYLLRSIGVDIPRTVRVGVGLKLPHSTTGLVLHPKTRVGNDVMIFHGVTIGRADIWQASTAPLSVEIGDHAILGAGASVMVRSGQHLKIGEGSVLGTNSVLTSDTEPWSVYAGSPAKKIRDRQH